MSPFQIVYGMHPRGVYELINLGKQEMRSADGEDFAVCRSYKKMLNKNCMKVLAITNRGFI